MHTLPNHPPPSGQFAIPEADLEVLGDGGYQVMSALIGNPSTVKQLSIRLNLSRARTKYIVDWLVTRDLVSLSQQVNEDNRLEQYYQSKVKDFTVQVRQSEQGEALTYIAQLAVDSLREHIIHRSSEREQAATLKLSQCRVRLAQLPELAGRLQALFAEFEALEDLSCEDEVILLGGFYRV